MKFAIEYNPDFYLDVVEAVEWYNARQSGLGNKLFNSIRKQTANLQKYALNFAIRYDDIRCFCVEKFPYLIHYRVNVQTKTVKVEALFHTSRTPKIWNERCE